MNGVCIDYLESYADRFPDWPNDKELEKRVLQEVLYPKAVDAQTLMGMVKRYMSNCWKYELVYGKESHIKGFWLFGGRSVGEKSLVSTKNYRIR